MIAVKVIKVHVVCLFIPPNGIKDSTATTQNTKLYTGTLLVHCNGVEKMESTTRKKAYKTIILIECKAKKIIIKIALIHKKKKKYRQIQ